MQKNLSRLRPYTLDKYQFQMDQKPKCKTRKFPENNIGENIDELGNGHDFLDIIPKPWCIKDTFDKLDFFSIK